MARVIIFWFSLMDIMALTRGHPDGAPLSACASMVPVHPGVSVQTGASTHIINASASNYSRGTPITVTISGTIKGVFLQARKVGSTTPVGTFSDLPSNTQLRACSSIDDSLTHSNANSKNELTITWNPPASSEGDIEFVATVAEEFAVYWLQQKSHVLSTTGYSGTSRISGMQIIWLIGIAFLSHASW